jgi:hypothetical protein
MVHIFPEGVMGPIKKIEHSGGESITVVDKWVFTLT